MAQAHSALSTSPVPRSAAEKTSDVNYFVDASAEVDALDNYLVTEATSRKPIATPYFSVSVTYIDTTYLWILEKADGPINNALKKSQTNQATFPTDLDDIIDAINEEIQNNDPLQAIACCSQGISELHKQQNVHIYLILQSQERTEEAQKYPLYLIQY